jgi:large subunit ribosomal protein L24
MRIQMSNVLLVCEKCGAATRLGARFLADGGKERFCKKCGAGNGTIAPAKARRAKKTANAVN